MMSRENEDGWILVGLLMSSYTSGVMGWIWSASISHISPYLDCRSVICLLVAVVRLLFVFCHG